MHPRRKCVDTTAQKLNCATQGPSGDFRERYGPGIRRSAAAAAALRGGGGAPGAQAPMGALIAVSGGCQPPGHAGGLRALGKAEIPARDGTRLESAARAAVGRQRKRNTTW